MKKRSYFILKSASFTFIFLAIFVLILSSCSKSDGIVTGGSDSTETNVSSTSFPASTESDPVEEDPYLTVSEDFVITKSDSAGKIESELVKKLKQAIKDSTGISLSVKTDWLKPDEEAPEYEIIIGETQRSESQAIYSALQDNEWCVAVSGNKIIITGKGSRPLTDAVNYFISNYVKNSVISVKKDTYHAQTDKFFEISFKDAETIKVTNSGSYPRLYQLKDGTLLCGIDGFCYRSEDNGTTWSNGVDYRKNYVYKPQSGGIKNLEVANSAFIEMEDGTLLVAYRATGYIDKDDKEFYTRIQASQSKDGGKTWTFHSILCEYFDHEGRYRGVWEPHFGYLNGVLTCFYSNDSYDVVKDYQHIEYLQWIDGKWTNRTVVANGDEHGSRDGMPVWTQLSSGEYVCAIEGFASSTDHKLTIKLFYSEDGINWSTPVIVFESPYGVGAPYVIELPTGQLLVSFQQSSDTSFGIMHCIVSDGTPVQYLTAENFSKPEKIFNTPDDRTSIWNGLFINDEYVYAYTGTDGYPNGILIKRIPLDNLYENAK